MSDIKEYFQSQASGENNSFKSPALGKQKDKTKDKDKDKDRGKSKPKQRGFSQEKSMDKDKNQVQLEDECNANGDQLTNHVDIEATSQGPNDSQSQDKINALETPEVSEMATQTSDDIIIQKLVSLQTKIDKLDETIEDPKNGLSSQLAKTNNKVDQIYSDIHGAVDGILVRLQQVTTSAKANADKLTQMESSQKRMLALLDENKRLVEELK